MGLIRDITQPVKDFFNGVSEEAFARAGGVFYVGAAGLINELNGDPTALDAERKELLRPDFGDLVDDVSIKYGAQMITVEVLGKRIGANPAAQTFGTQIYVEGQYQAGDRGQLELIAHELVHSRQYLRADASLYEFGRKYFREYYRAGFDYADNEMEVEADQFASCFMHRVGSTVQYNNLWSADWAQGWSSLVPYQFGNEVYVQIYSQTSGSAKFLHVRSTGLGTDTVAQDDWSEGWTTFAPFNLNGVPHCLSYKNSGGAVHLYRFNPGGNGYTKTGEDDWTSGWSTIMPFVLDGQPHYLAYKVGTGKVSIGKFKADGTGVNSLWSGTWTTGWTSFYPFTHAGRPHYLAYKIDGGGAAISAINAAGLGVSTLWRGDWSDGWTIFLPLSANGKDFLAFKGESTVQALPGVQIPVSGNGRAHVSMIGNDPRTGTETRWCKLWRGSWKCATSFPLNGVYHTLFYGADNDAVSISRFVPR